MKKLILASLLAFGGIGTAQAADGCKAILCFAGGMHEPECRSTIREVLHDISRGKPFPTCKGYEGEDITASARTEIHQIKSADFICPDKKTPPVMTLGNSRNDIYKHFCKRVDVTVPVGIAANAEYQHQIHYYHPNK